eukprot:1872584-Pyramimonas_sp.AAC.1
MVTELREVAAVKAAQRNNTLDPVGPRETPQLRGNQQRVRQEKWNHPQHHAPTPCPKSHQTDPPQ